LEITAALLTSMVMKSVSYYRKIDSVYISPLKKLPQGRDSYV